MNTGFVHPGAHNVEMNVAQFNNKHHQPKPNTTVIPHTVHNTGRPLTTPENSFEHETQNSPSLRTALTEADNYHSNLATTESSLSSRPHLEEYLVQNSIVVNLDPNSGLNSPINLVQPRSDSDTGILQKM